MVVGTTGLKTQGGFDREKLALGLDRYSS
jgi:hypothetical protein